MNFREEYEQKLVSAADAVKVIKSGDWVDYGWSAGTPVALDKALAARANELSDVKLRGGVLLWEPEVFKVENVAEHFTWNSWHSSGIERKAISAGFGYHSPMRYSELPRYYREFAYPDDVAMFQVAPMDQHGYFNFGTSASHMMAVCETSKIIIVEVNKNMPKCLGGFENDIHISKVDMIVEGDNPPIGELKPSTPGKVDEDVAKLVLEEIPNGACLQLGIGSMPDAVGSLIAASDLKNLGVHSEMYVDSFVEMSKAGKINGSKKNIDTYRQTYTFAAGTKKLYDYINNNPELMSAPVNYVNDIRTISAIDNFISINNAVDVDLFGQVNSESSGTKHISGAGGQLDFVLGSYLSKGGKSIICCSSTYKTKAGELKSRILPVLNSGSIITDPRSAVQYLVTEYGKVNLKGLSTWKKCESIISVAHPDFRDQLIAEAEKMKIWRKSNKI